jgi:hypothetical protein
MSLLRYCIDISPDLLLLLKKTPALVKIAILLSSPSSVPPYNENDLRHLSPALQAHVKETMTQNMAALNERLRTDQIEILNADYPQDAQKIISELKGPAFSAGIDWRMIDLILKGSVSGTKMSGQALLGGSEIGDEYPARYLTPEQVREISAALDKISEDDFKRGFKRLRLSVTLARPFIQSWRWIKSRLGFGPTLAQEVQTFKPRSFVEENSVFSINLKVSENYETALAGFIGLKNYYRIAAQGNKAVLSFFH